MGRIISYRLDDKDRPRGRVNRKILDATTEEDIERHEAEDEIAWQEYVEEKRREDAAKAAKKAAAKGEDAAE
jgi:hypothetical protein